ncbi:YggT family protein [Clostridium sp. BJN0001]|uniref:YggT family protein n=1 Tax=Clostridium sp. BJN0001 TaxID=2930219 RepID=UPI001FD2B288|nr:YggT family protein [Clostridium sp. BJN0001]
MSILIYKAFNALFKLFELLILIECIASFAAPYSNNDILCTIKRITAPILEPIRKFEYRMFPSLPLDFSPIIAIFIFDLLRKFLIRILFI